MLGPFALSALLTTADTFAVLDIETKTPELQSVGARLSAYVKARLAAEGGRITPDAELRTTMARMAKESHQSCVDESCQIELGRQVAASHAMTTRLVRFQDRCILSATRIDLTREVVDGGFAWEGSCEEEGLVRVIDAEVPKLLLPRTASEDVYALLPFSASSGLSAPDAQVLTDYAFGTLAQSGWRLIPQSQVRSEVAKLKRQSHEDCYDPSCQIELGKALAATKAVYPSVTPLAGACSLAFSRFDIGTGVTDGGGVSQSECTSRGLLNAVRKALSFNACRTTPGAEPGFLTLDTQPFSVVYFEDRRLGETPLAKVKLPAGCLELRLVSKEASIDKVVPVQIKSNRTQRYLMDLEKAWIGGSSEEPETQEPSLHDRTWALFRRLESGMRPETAAQIRLALVEAGTNEEALEKVRQRIEFAY